MIDDNPQDRRTQRQVYVRRGARMTSSQARGYERLERYRYDEQLEPTAAFGREAPLVVEIGFGNGEVLCGYAAENPDWNCIGVEVYRPGIGALVRRCEELKLANVRIAENEALTFIESLPSTCVDRFFVFFPDPWPKKRHHKRRLINEPFLNVAIEKLVERGTIQISTDWRDYAEAIDELMSAQTALQSCNSVSCFERPKTRFERRGEDLGHQVWDFCYRRVPNP